MNFLIVDDDVVFSEVLMRSLQHRGHQVWKTTSPHDACQLATKHQPDACILDLKLDGESGLQWIEPLNSSSPTMRILMLTGYASLNTAVMAVKKGAYNYLAKPATIAEILVALFHEPVIDVMDEGLMSVDRLEWEHLQQALQLNQGNISATARSLHMHRRTLQRKLAKKPSSV